VEALKALPPKHRLAVVLHHLAQMSAAEIAEQQGVAEGTVRSWLSRGRAKLATQLQDGSWQEADRVPFRPAGTAAIAREVKARKRLRQSGVAAAVVVVLAVAAAVVAVLARQDGEPPVIGPTTPPESPSPSPEIRPIRLQGTAFESLPFVMFADGIHGWLLYQTCTSDASVGPCRRAIARTDDGGLNWRAANLPQIKDGNVLHVVGVEPDFALLREVPREGRGLSYWWVVRDHGNSFIRYEEKDPPTEALMANGGYRFVCPGQTSVTPDEECQTRTLVRGPDSVVPTQPPLNDISTAVQGADRDGRLWVVRTDNAAAQTQVAVSEDGAQTWRRLPTFNAGHGRLEVSPDGTDVWFAGLSGYWHLEGGQWQRRMAPLTADGPFDLLDGGVWLVRRDKMAGYLKDGVFTPIIETSSTINWVWALPDGTAQMSEGNGYYLGLGTGTDRRWIRLQL